MNKKYKYFIFSDVHGEYDALIESLKNANYDKNNSRHKLVSLGDNFDRGKNNYEVYEFLLLNNAFMIKGNHDVMLENFLYYKDASFDILHNGLDRTIVDFAGMFKNTTKNKVIREMLQLSFKINSKHPNLKKMIAQMPYGYKIDNYILTHAGFTNSIRIDYHDDTRWYPNEWTNTPDFISKYDGFTGKFNFIFGHWHAWRLTKEFIGIENNDSHIFNLNNFTGIDACSNLTNRVNIYTIETNSEPIPFSNKSNIQEIKNM